jgi:hypothetical protein
VTSPTAAAATPGHALAAAPRSWRAAAWLIQDLPYIAMLVLALIGVTFREPVRYWVILVPVFGIICIAAGWRHAVTARAQITLIATQGLNWAALILAIYVLYDSGSQGVMNVNASSLAIMTLLALGTFTAGLQARLWRICAVACVLFAEVPPIGWLDQSSLMMVAGTALVIAAGGLTWWVVDRRRA